MDNIKTDDILFKHLILFNFDTSKSISFINPHHVFKIEDSIHYNSLLKSNYDDYINLIKTTNQKEHSLLGFLNLINNFDIKKLLVNKIKIEWNDKLNKYITIDGCHRLSIIKYNKLDVDGYLPIEYFEIKNKK